MADKHTEITQQAEEQQVKMLSDEQSAGAGSDATGSTNESEAARSTQSDSDELATLGVVPCQEFLVPCADALMTSRSLSTLSFNRSQEDSIQEVVRLSEGSREQVLERLWERVMTRLLHEEAERVLREAKPE